VGLQGLEDLDELILFSLHSVLGVVHKLINLNSCLAHQQDCAVIRIIGKGDYAQVYNISANVQDLPWPQLLLFQKNELLNDFCLEKARMILAFRTQSVHECNRFFRAWLRK
jgi:hypothetical protein